MGKENDHSSASASVHSDLSDYIQNHKISLPDFEFNEKDIEDDDEGGNDSDDIEQEFQSIYESTSFERNYSELSDNWLFRRVNTRSCMNEATSSVASASSPVGMLVPSPTQDCPTLIGNRNADDISDLSENGSDIESLHGELSDSERQRSSTSFDLPHVLVESKTLIGGKNEMNSFEQSKAALFDLLEPDSLVSEQSLTGQSPAISEAKNNLILIEDRSSPNTFTAATKTIDSIRKMNPIEQNSDLLIRFDSLEAYNNDSIEYESNNNEKNVFNTLNESNKRLV